MGDWGLGLHSNGYEVKYSSGPAAVFEQKFQCLKFPHSLLTKTHLLNLSYPSSHARFETPNLEKGK